jgi:hypothetical protein
MSRLTMGMRSEKRVVRRFRLCANVIVYLHKPRSLSPTTHLGYKPVQYITALNTVDNCNTTVIIIILKQYITILKSYGTIVVYAVRR